MTPIIEKLLIIQDHDLRILKFEKELADIPLRKKAIDSMLDEHRQAVTAAKEVLKTRQAGIKKCEQEIEAYRDKIRKYREQQMQLKNNQEFRAMENEITGVEKLIRQCEDKILEIMETVESAQEDVKLREDALKLEEKGVSHEFSTIEGRGSEIKGELDRVKQLRAGYAADVDPVRLAQYDRFFKNKKAKVLVAVEDNGTCGGCHMKLPPYICHDAKKQADVVACGYCGRMLY
ncbi:MAG: C4-type zinc ribbon domain-containing protein [bacterium]|jgi:predicted  nucleic acid-binding Zn-ribbon protein